MINNLIKKSYRAIHRFSSKALSKRDYDLNLSQPIISFTFDDFPQNAAQKGLDLLTRYGFKATYFISFGIIDQNTATGKICTIKDIENVVQSGNELGCHTFNHMGAYEESYSAFEDSINENQKFLQNTFPQLKFSVFSYPRGQVKPRTKEIVQKYYKCARGISPGINIGRVDLSF